MSFPTFYGDYLQTFETLQVLKSMFIDFLDVIVTQESAIKRFKSADVYFI